MDATLTALLHRQGPARAVVTITAADTPTGTTPGGTVDGSRTDPAIVPGPYAAAKNAVLAAAGPGVRVVRDYDRLPVVLVEIADSAALARLTGSGLVASVQAERRHGLTR